MANIYDPEKTKGVIEISLAEDETPASVRDRFSFLVRSLFKQKGQRVKSLQLELLEEDSAAREVKFHFVAETYDYDFIESERYWQAYERLLTEGY